MVVKQLKLVEKKDLQKLKQAARISRHGLAATTKWIKKGKKYNLDILRLPGHMFGFKDRYILHKQPPKQLLKGLFPGEYPVVS